MRKFRVVLVEPEHPHNVGFVARAMHCYALPELYIVYPKRDKVLDKSYHTAANSHYILDNAKVVHKFEDWRLLLRRCLQPPHFRKLHQAYDGAELV